MNKTLCSLLALSFLLLLLPAAFAQYKYIDMDSDDPRNDHVLKNTFSGNTPYFGVYLYQDGDPWWPTNWTFYFRYNYGQYDTNGMVSVTGSVASNLVSFNGGTNVFFEEYDAYYFSVVATHNSGATKTWGTGRMVQEYDPAAGSPNALTWITVLNWGNYTYTGNPPWINDTNYFLAAWSNLLSNTIFFTYQYPQAVLTNNPYYTDLQANVFTNSMDFEAYIDMRTNIIIGLPTNGIVYVDGETEMQKREAAEHSRVGQTNAAYLAALTNGAVSAGTNFAVSTSGRIFTIDYPTNLNYWIDYWTLLTQTNEFGGDVSGIWSNIQIAASAVGTNEANLTQFDTRYLRATNTFLSELVVGVLSEVDSELVNNGGFTSATHWVLNNCSINANRVEMNSGLQGYAAPSNDISITQGKTYAISIYKGTGGGTNIVYLGGDSWTVTDSGTSTWHLSCSDSATNLHVWFGTGGDSDWFTQVSVREITNGSAYVSDDLFVGGVIAGPSMVAFSNSILYDGIAANAINMTNFPPNDITTTNFAQDVSLIAGSTPTFTLRANDVTDPTFVFVNGTNQIDLSLDASAAPDRLMLQGMTAGIGTRLDLLSQDGQGMQLRLYSGETNYSQITMGAGDALTIQNTVEDENLILGFNDGGTNRTITLNASDNLLQHSGGTFNFDNDNLETTGIFIGPASGMTLLPLNQGTGTVADAYAPTNSFFRDGSRPATGGWNGNGQDFTNFWITNCTIYGTTNFFVGDGEQVEGATNIPNSAGYFYMTSSTGLTWDAVIRDAHLSTNVVREDINNTWASGTTQDFGLAIVIIPDSSATNHPVTQQELHERLPGLFRLYAFSINSAVIDGYASLSNVVSARATQTNSHVDLTDGQTITNYVIGSNDFGFAEIGIGVYIWQYHAVNPSPSGDRDVALQFELMYSNSAGGAVVSMGTSEVSEVIGTGTGHRTLHLDISDTEADRWPGQDGNLIVRLIAVVTGSGNAPELDLLLEGDTSTRVEINVPGQQFQPLDADLTTLAGVDADDLRIKSNQKTIQMTGTDQQYCFSAPYGCTITAAKIISDIATTGSDAGTNWSVYVRNLTQSENLGNATNTGGTEISGDTPWALLIESNATLAADDVLELQITSNGVPLTDLSGADLFIRVDYR
jgi:hypothetical protein